MNKKSIFQMFCEQFGMLDDDGNPLLIDTISKQMTFAQLGRHFDLLSELLAIEINQSFLEGEVSGMNKSKAIFDDVLKGDHNDNK